jgi:hypothetical protein
MIAERHSPLLCRTSTLAPTAKAGAEVAVAAAVAVAAVVQAALGSLTYCGVLLAVVPSVNLTA